MTMGKWRSRKYADSDLTGVLDLLRTVFGEEGQTPEWWEWKYKHNPSGDAIIYVAESTSGQIVGLRALWPWTFAFQNHTILGYQAVDTATHPDFQRQGIFTAMTMEAIEEAKERDGSFVLNFPNDQSLPGYCKLGWKRVARLRWLIKIINPMGLALWGAHRAISFLSARPRSKPASGYIGGSLESSCSKSLTMDNEQLRELSVSAGVTDFIATMRTEEFLRWRYAGRPQVWYECQTLKKYGRVAGYIIYRCGWRRGLKEVVIMDMLVDQDESTARTLLSAVERAARAYAVHYIATFLPQPGTLHSKVLGKSGYYLLPRKTVHFTVRPLTQESLLDYSMFGYWLISPGDLDTF